MVSRGLRSAAPIRALTSVAAIYLAMLLELDRPEWAGWTVLSVSLATRASSLQKSLWRAISSIIGCGIAVALTANFAQSTLAFDAAIALWLALLTAAASVERGLRSYGFALMGYTVPIVTLANVDQPGLVFHVAVDRCSTLLLGIACAHASSVLVAPGVREVSSSLADRLDAAATACGEWLRAVERGDRTGRGRPLGRRQGHRLAHGGGGAAGGVGVDDGMAGGADLPGGGADVREAGDAAGDAAVAAVQLKRLRIGVKLQQVVHSIRIREADGDQTAVSEKGPNGLSPECPTEDPSSRAVSQKSFWGEMHAEAGRGQLRREREDGGQMGTAVS